MDLHKLTEFKIKQNNQACLYIYKLYFAIILEFVSISFIAMEIVAIVEEAGRDEKLVVEVVMIVPRILDILEEVNDK